MALANLINWTADADHRPDVSIASEAAIEYHETAAHGTCCTCHEPIVAVYDGIDDDPSDTRWHHMDTEAVLASMA